jgi:hypothetical protein
MIIAYVLITYIILLVYICIHYFIILSKSLMEKLCQQLNSQCLKSAMRFICLKEMAILFLVILFPNFPECI